MSFSRSSKPQSGGVSAPTSMACVVDVQQMVQDAADFAIEHADDTARARGTSMPQQLFDGEREGVLLVHRRDVVEPVEIRQRLQIGLVLDQLLGAAVQQADMRIDALDDFAVELEHQAQHAVRRRMLRPEVDREVADFGLGRRRHGSPSLGRLFVAGQDVLRALPGAHEVELAEVLHQLHRLVDDAFFRSSS